MKKHYKIMILPIIVTIIVFSIAMLMVEYQVKSIFEKKLQEELETTALFALSSLNNKKLNNKKFNTNTPLADDYFDRIADNVAKISKFRVSYILPTGRLLGDSTLNFDTINKSRKLRPFPEINAAITNGSSYSFRSNDVNNKILSYAQFDHTSGIIARISAPQKFYSNPVINMRIGFVIIISIALATIIVFSYTAMRLFKRADKQEKLLLEKEIAVKTQEITLIQTMTTLINDAENIDEAGIIVAKILPNLLTGLSGAIYLTKVPERLLKKVSHWGAWPQEIQIAVNNGQTNFDVSFESITDDTKYSNEYFLKHSFNVNLVADNQVFGKLFFLKHNAIIDEQMRNIMQHLSETINCALANVQLKIQLREQATKDPLTGLYNRRYMLDTLEQALHQAERYQHQVAVLMIDLDHFKIFNDKFGHAAGDKVLAQVAEQFLTNLRLEDIACRYGGEEFCIICPETKVNDAYQLAEKLRLKIANLSFHCEENIVENVNLSIGIAVYSVHADNAHELLIQADKALYLAKHNGRNCTEIAQTKIDKDKNNKLA